VRPSLFARYRKHLFLVERREPSGCRRARGDCREATRRHDPAQSSEGEMNPDEREALWQASVRRYNARREEENRAAWAPFHEGQAASLRQILEDLISHHETQAERYRDRPKGAANA
jgi:hypothetical protein